MFGHSQLSAYVTDKHTRTSSLTDCAGSFASVCFQKLDYLCFLGGRTATHDHTGTLTRQFHKLVLVELQAHLRNAKGINSSRTEDRRLLFNTVAMVILIYSDIKSEAAQGLIPSPTHLLFILITLVFKYTKNKAIEIYEQEKIIEPFL